MEPDLQCVIIPVYSDYPGHMVVESAREIFHAESDNKIPWLYPDTQNNKH